MNELKYCNWSFEEPLGNGKWMIARDCDNINLKLNDEPITILLVRGANKKWKAYRASLQPQIQQRFPYPRPGAQCPNCGNQINGVNPYDDGETWRK